MKRFILLLIYSFVFMASVPAQVSLHLEDIDNPGGNETVVSSWDNVGVVSYYRMNGIGRLELVEATMYSTPKYIGWPTNVFVYDMYINEDILYFCGYMMYGIPDTLTIGVLGYVKLMEFYSPNVTVHYTPIPEVSRLKKLVEYNDAGAHVVAVGVKEWGFYDTTNNYTFSRSILFNCPDLMATPVAYEWKLPDLVERYDDVLLTDNYVAFMGYVTSIDALCFRRDYRSFPFGSLFDYVHYFQPGTMESFSLLHSTTMSKDTVATSYMYIDPVTGAVKTRIRSFDIGTPQMLWSQQFDVPEKVEPKGLVYIKDDNSLVLMEDIKRLGVYSTNFFFIEPWTMSDYMSFVEFRKKILFSSITDCSNTFYVAGEGASWFVRNKTLSPTNNPDNDCPMVDNNKVYIIDNIEPRVHFLFLYGDNPQHLEATESFDVNIGTGTINCINVELKH